MINESDVIDHMEKGHFLEAVSTWRELATEKGYFGGSAKTSWALSARLLEARLIYLSMFKQDEVFRDFVDRYRAWLLDQVAHIATPTELSMERFALPPSMRVGHPDIDRDHETLFAMANDIRDALRRDDRDQAATLADGLIDEVIEHFNREEKVLIEVGFPDAKTHAKYHGVLRSKAEEMRKVLFGLLSRNAQSVITFDMLVSFLVNDPIAADMDIKAFFRNREINHPVTTEISVPAPSAYQSASRDAAPKD